MAEIRYNGGRAPLTTFAAMDKHSAIGTALIDEPAQLIDLLGESITSNA